MNESILYGIIRTDIPDMNPGKAAAQLMHGANLFEDYVDKQYDDILIEYYTEWRGDRGFGTTITVMADFETIKDMVHSHIAHSNFIIDETYPFRGFDGQIYTMEQTTGAWAFLTPHSKLENWELIKSLPLMP